MQPAPYRTGTGPAVLELERNCWDWPYWNWTGTAGTGPVVLELELGGSLEFAAVVALVQGRVSGDG